MLRYLAKFATSLHAAVQLPFQWTGIEDNAYKALKVMLSQAPVVQFLDWSQPFHIFVDASDVAIGSANRWLSTAKKNYSTTEREALGMIYNITKCKS